MTSRLATPAGGRPSGLPGTVLQIASGDLWAGAENQIWQLSRALVELGVDVKAVLLNDGELGARLRDARVPVVVLNEQQLSFPTLVRRTIAEFRRSRPVVAHSHRGKDMLLATFGALSVDCAHVRTLHGAPEFERQTLRGRLKDTAEGWAYRRLDSLVEVAPNLAKTVAMRSGHACRIANGLDPTALREGADPPADLPPAPDGRLALVGRLVSVKRPDRFLTTLAKLRDAGLDVRGLIIGDGPLRDECVNLAAQMGLASHLDMVGNQRTPARWLSQADVLIVCSEHEGLPMVVLEAMALGVLVIAPPLGAIPEVLEHGRGGVLVPSVEPEAMTRAAVEALNDRGTAARLREYARTRVVEHYSSRVSAERYHTLYKALLTDRAQGDPQTVTQGTRPG